MSENQENRKENGKLVMQAMVELREPVSLQRIRENIVEKLEVRNCVPKVSIYF